MLLSGVIRTRNVGLMDNGGYNSNGFSALRSAYCHSLYAILECFACVIIICMITCEDPNNAEKSTSFAFTEYSDGNCMQLFWVVIKAHSTEMQGNSTGQILLHVRGGKTPLEGIKGNSVFAKFFQESEPLCGGFDKQKLLLIFCCSPIKIQGFLGWFYQVSTTFFMHPWPCTWEQTIPMSFKVPSLSKAINLVLQWQ